MKKIFFSMMAFALVACVSLTSCCNDDEQPVVPPTPPTPPTPEVLLEDLFKDGSVTEIAFQNDEGSYDMTLKHVDGAMQLTKFIYGGIDITDNVKNLLQFIEVPNALIIGQGETIMSMEMMLALDTERNTYTLNVSEFNVNKMKVNSLKVNGKEFIQTLENKTPVMPVPTLADLMDPANEYWSRIVFGPYKGYNQIEILTHKKPTSDYEFSVYADNEPIHDFDQAIRVGDEDGVFFIKWAGEGGIALDSNDNTYDDEFEGATLRKVEIKNLNILSKLSYKPIFE